ncbi:MAG: hypothetical protein ACYCZL_03900 [Polaromonas sp.]
MPKLDAQLKAAELQRQFATLTGHDLAHVKPYGKHLLIQMQRGDSLDTIARLSETARNTYSAAFRSHTGRWEPLPASGDIASTAELLVTLLAPYFDSNN